MFKKYENKTLIQPLFYLYITYVNIEIFAGSFLVYLLFKLSISTFIDFLNSGQYLTNYFIITWPVFCFE